MVPVLANIDVPDLDRAVQFYCRALSLRVGRRLFENSVAELVGASSRIYLLTRPDGSSPSAHVQEPRGYHRHWTPVHLDFAVEDVEEAVRQAREAGATLEGEIQTHVWGRIAYFSDPFGHGFCLIQFLGRGYDEVA